MATIAAPVPSPLWRIAQICGLLLTVVLLTGLLLQPDPTLRLLWYTVIPILPAVFLANPGLWRNVCPLATLNTLPGRISRGHKLPARGVAVATVIGIALLLVLVPARRFLFNTDGTVLAAVIVAVGLLALAAGFVFDRKAGFCGSICPVLPVERLYGQAPLHSVQNAHCPTCTLCVSRACLDLSATRSVPQLLGTSRRSHAWLRQPWGAFAAAFPGFIVAYSLIPDGPLSGALMVYGWVLVGMVVSWAIVASLVFGFGIPSALALRGLAALALFAYYWFAAASIASAWAAGTGVVHGIRGAAALLIVFWWLRTARTEARHALVTLQ